MKYLFLYFYLLMFSCCSKEYLSNQIVYVKDSKTGLCFAFIKMVDVSPESMSCVPCDSIPDNLLSK